MKKMKNSLKIAGYDLLFKAAENDDLKEVSVN